MIWKHDSKHGEMLQAFRRKMSECYVLNRKDPSEKIWVSAIAGQIVCRRFFLSFFRYDYIAVVVIIDR